MALTRNIPLEKFWRNLASNKVVCVIYTNNTHEYIKMPNKNTQKFFKKYDEFYNNSSIEAVLSSNPSIDAYELHLYPKAKDKTVDYVINNYKKFFKPISLPSNISADEKKLYKKIRIPK